MSEFNIEVQGGSSVRLPTAGKYCEQDIIVTASGGGDSSELENLIDASGVLGTTDETATATDKVEKLIEKSEAENIWYEMTKHVVEYTAGFMNSTVIKKLPRADFSNVQKFNDFFNNSSIEEIDFYIDCKSCTNMTRMFLNTPNLKRIVGLNTTNVLGFQQMFANSAIEVIDRPLDCSKVTNNASKINFDAAPNLREIRFVESCIAFSTVFNSKELTVNSAKSIILGLKSYANDNINGYNYTLTLDEAVWVKLDAEEGIEAPDGTIVSWRTYVDMYLWWNT